jgi:plastocyanin
MSVLLVLRSRVSLAFLALGLALVLAAACNGDDGGGGETPAAGETPAGGETPAAGGATAEIKMLPGIQYDKSELTIAADTEVTVTADNTDTGIPHSFAVYASAADAQSGADPIDQTGICTGPCTDTATLNVSAGEYFFRCEVHPQQMTGTLIVQ